VVVAVVVMMMMMVMVVVVVMMMMVVVVVFGRMTSGDGRRSPCLGGIRGSRRFRLVVSAGAACLSLWWMTGRWFRVG
jgi:heme/copper-type cytochrome/quinol oxidase subunit 2